MAFRLPRELWLRCGLGAVLPAVLVLAWGYGARSGSSVVPGFQEVWSVLSHPFDVPRDLLSGSLAESTGLTVLRLGLGFLLALVTAVPLGVWAGRDRRVAYLLQPAVEAARPINPIVMLPLLTVFLGLSSLGTLVHGVADAWRYPLLDQLQTTVVLILWAGAFFPIYTSTVHGVRGVRTAHLEMLDLIGATRWHRIRWVVWPHCLPSVVNGMRIGLGVSWLVVVAAEAFPGTHSGLGHMLCTACNTAEYEYTFAAAIVIGVLGVFSSEGLRRLEVRVSRWQAAER
ncbi:MAG: ABC transporter permease [Deferrisomatales bacterium]|nr:ABC transporter permease [Deferrisomatales bacterium]